MNDFKHRVELIVSAIPKGQVMTYGQIAALSGNSRAARLVGGIAHFSNDNLPWHRVVNRLGGLASGYPGGRLAQSEHLKSEGVIVSSNYYLNLEHYLYVPK